MVDPALILASFVERKLPNREATLEITNSLKTRPGEAFDIAESLVRSAGESSEVLTWLEEMASFTPTLSLILMIGLYEAAGEREDHGVCDAIVLWLFHRGNPEVQAFLSKCVSEPGCPIEEKAKEWLRSFKWTA